MSEDIYFYLSQVGGIGLPLVEARDDAKQPTASPSDKELPGPEYINIPEGGKLCSSQIYPIVSPWIGVFSQMTLNLSSVFLNYLSM